MIVLLAFLAVPIVAGTNGSWSSRTVLAILLIILAVGLAALTFAFYLADKRRQALRLLDMAHVDIMTGLEFERWCGEQLRQRGYKVTFTPINDYGVDIVARRDGVRTAVQVKRYKRALDQKPVREAVAGMLQYKCTRSMVITNSYFTAAAKVLAHTNNCELIDREKLAQWLAQRSKS